MQGAIGYCSRTSLPSRRAPWPVGVMPFRAFLACHIQIQPSPIRYLGKLRDSKQRRALKQLYEANGLGDANAVSLSLYSGPMREPRITQRNNASMSRPGVHDRAGWLLSGDSKLGNQTRRDAWVIGDCRKIGGAAANWLFRICSLAEGGCVAWMLRLVKIGAEGKGACTDIMEIRRPDDLVDIANLGLTLAEAKLLLAGVQREIVAAQARGHAVRRPECPRCDGVCRVKDYRDHAVATLFGEVTVRLPRFRCAACGGIEAGIAWPAHCRSTPELDRLQAHLSALMTYRTAADVLGRCSRSLRESISRPCPAIP